MFKKFLVSQLCEEFDKLQLKYGEKTLDSIYGAGCVNNPSICFIFMNPTARNMSAFKEWKGLKAPWIGTKNIWKLFNSLELLDSDILNQIKIKKAHEWDCRFSEIVYENIAKNKLYVTNLAKCTQADARALKDNIFYEYLPLLKKELSIVKPKIIVTFGNQVSSIFLGQKISVSKVRKQRFDILINKVKYSVYPVYYPVGQGMRNIGKAEEDIKYIKKAFGRVFLL